MGAVNSTYEGCFCDSPVSQKSSSSTLDDCGRHRQHKKKHSHALDEETGANNEVSRLKTRKRSDFPFKDFKILETLGRGTFGKVYLVRNKEYFALKTIKKHDVLRKNILNCTIRDKKLIKDIKHPFILDLKNTYQGKSNAYLLTEFCPGGNLSERLKKDRKFELNTVKMYAAELILAIQYIHESLNMIHRDINPENILLASDGHIKLTDFGVSKTLTKSITCYGTADYQAPEVTSGHAYGPEADWWSLGCLIFHMLVGEPLFVYQRREKPIDHTIKELPQLPVYFSKSLKDLLTKLLKKKPKERLGSKGTQEIRNHPFFGDIDWDLILDKQYKAPLKVPSIEEATVKYEPIFNEGGSLEVSWDPKSVQCGDFDQHSPETRDSLSNLDESPTK